MKTFKKLANAAAISIASCTTLSVILYMIFGHHGGFLLLNPFDMNFNPLILSSYPLQTAKHSLLLYIAIGIFFWTTSQLFRNNQFGLKKANALHFLISFLAFFIIIQLVQGPLLYHFPLSWLVSYYTQTDPFQLYWVYLKPALTIIIGYLLAWGLMWGHYRYEISQVNKKLPTSVPKQDKKGWFEKMKHLFGRR